MHPSQGSEKGGENGGWEGEGREGWIGGGGRGEGEWEGEGGEGFSSTHMCGVAIDNGPPVGEHFFHTV